MTAEASKSVASNSLSHLKLISALDEPVIMDQSLVASSLTSVASKRGCWWSLLDRLDKKIEEKQLMSLEKLLAEISCFQRYLWVVEWICYIGMDIVSVR